VSASLGSTTTRTRTAREFSGPSCFAPGALVFGRRAAGTLTSPAFYSLDCLGETFSEVRLEPPANSTYGNPRNPRHKIRCLNPRHRPKAGKIGATTAARLPPATRPRPVAPAAARRLSGGCLQRQGRHRGGRGAGGVGGQKGRIDLPFVGRHVGCLGGRLRGRRRRHRRSYSESCFLAASPARMSSGMMPAPARNTPRRPRHIARCWGSR